MISLGNTYYHIVGKMDKENKFLYLYFSENFEENRCEVHHLVLGCKLLVDLDTKKFQVLQIPIDYLGCKPKGDLFSAHYESTDCFVISLRSLKPEDRVKTRVDYMDSIIFDTQENKIVRIEIIGTQFLNL